jgi:hypothetical protein
MKFHLLRTADINAARHEVAKAGLHMTQILGDRLVEIHAPDDFDPTVLETATPIEEKVAPEDPDHPLIKAWRGIGAATQEQVVPQPKPGGCAGAGQTLSGDAAGAGVQQPFLMGVVAITVVLLDVGIKTFSTNDYADTIGAICVENRALAIQAPAQCLTIRMGILQATASPQIRPVESGSYFVGELMGGTLLALGQSPQPSSAVVAFVNGLLQSKGADSAGLCAVTKVPMVQGPPKYVKNVGSAYIPDRTFILTTNGSSAPAPNLYTHELLHLWGALDEYEGSCDPSEVSANPWQTPNCNCQSTGGDFPSCCGGGTHLACVMNQLVATGSPCVWTRQQVGWSSWVMPSVPQGGLKFIACAPDGSLWGIDNGDTLWVAGAPALYQEPKWQNFRLGRAAWSALSPISDTQGYGVGTNRYPYTITLSGVSMEISLMSANPPELYKVAPCMNDSELQLYGLGSNNRLYQWSFKTSNWNEVDGFPHNGTITNIAAAWNAGILWCIDNQQNAFSYNVGNGASWEESFGPDISQIGVSSDGLWVYGCMPAGGEPRHPNLYTLTGQGSRSPQFVPLNDGYVTSVALGGPSTGTDVAPGMWALDQNNALLRRNLLATK